MNLSLHLQHIPLPASPALPSTARFSDEELVSSVQDEHSSSSDSESDGLKTPPATDLERVALYKKDFVVVVDAKEVVVTGEVKPISHAPVITEFAQIETIQQMDDTVPTAIALRAEANAAISLAASIPLPRSRNNIRKPKVKAVVLEEPVIVVAAPVENKKNKKKTRNKKNKSKVKIELVPSPKSTSKPKLAFRVVDKAINHPIFRSEDPDVVAAAFLAGPLPPDVGVWSAEVVQTTNFASIAAASASPIVSLPRKRHTPPVARTHANATARKVNASL